MTLEADLDATIPDIESHTIGGLVMELLDKVPQVDDEVRIDGHLIRVLAMDGNRVDQVMITPEPGGTREEATSER